MRRKVRKQRRGKEMKAYWYVSVVEAVVVLVLALIGCYLVAGTDYAWLGNVGIAVFFGFAMKASVVRFWLTDSSLSVIGMSSLGGLMVMLMGRAAMYSPLVTESSSENWITIVVGVPVIIFGLPLGIGMMLVIIFRYHYFPIPPDLL
ncbi:hypothetical protein HN748_05595 [Candidatus Peregrinibacteria bacterium]|nr:hypothetical protein [Candidatus Peregrinibacteria bacterium]